MAITTKIWPAKLVPAYNNVITVVDSDNKNEDDFRFIFDVYNGTTNTLLSRVKLPAAPSGYGVFDAHRILETQVSSEIRPQLTTWVVASSAFFDWDLKIGEEFKYVWEFDDNYFDSGSVAFTSYTMPHYFEIGDEILITQNTTGATNESYDGVHTVTAVPNSYAFTIDVTFGASTSPEAGTAVYSDFRKTQFTGLTSTTGNFIWDGAVSHQSFRNYDFTDYILDAVNPGQILTNVPNNWEFDIDSEAYVLVHQTGGTNAQYIRFDLSNGATYRLTNGSPTTKFLAAPVGPYNINNSAIGNVIDSTITRYSAYTENASSARTSNILVFDVYENCAGNPYTQYQIIFKDRLGSFISFNFDLASSKTVNIKRDEYKKITGAYSYASNTWGYNSYDRGRTVFNVEATEEYRLTSNWISEANGFYLEELFTSPEVYHIDSNGDWLPIIIKDNSFRYKYRNTEKLINYELNFSYAFNNIIQRG